MGRITLSRNPALILHYRINLINHGAFTGFSTIAGTGLEQFLN